MQKSRPGKAGPFRHIKDIIAVFIVNRDRSNYITQTIPERAFLQSKPSDAILLATKDEQNNTTIK